MRELWTWVQPGAKVPCSICQTLTLTADLTECWVPAAIITMGPGVEIMPKVAVWVCPDCPIPGEV